MAVFLKSYENVLIRVFLHAEFISALKTEPKSMVFEKYAKNRKKIFIIIILYLVEINLWLLNRLDLLLDRENLAIVAVFILFHKLEEAGLCQGFPHRSEMLPTQLAANAFWHILQKGLEPQLRLQIGIIGGYCSFGHDISGHFPQAITFRLILT